MTEENPIEIVNLNQHWIKSLKKSLGKVFKKLSGKNGRFTPLLILLAILVIATSALAYKTELKVSVNWREKDIMPEFEKKILPAQGFVLPVRWGDLGIKLVNAGVIDRQKFDALYSQRGGLDEETRKLLENNDNGNLVINSQNSGALLNLLWALGLGNKNEILEKGPMSDPKYGGAGKFASTGGWTLAKGKTMDHFSHHSFFNLTPEQQKMVERTSGGIYRPCCGNPTHFPDCNHGMAMLGLLELMASQGVSEDQMYKVALEVNGYWFPDNYLTIAKFLKLKGMDWDKIGPKEILGYNFSSGPGYRQILNQVTTPVKSAGGSCGV